MLFSLQYNASISIEILAFLELDFRLINVEFLRFIYAFSNNLERLPIQHIHEGSEIALSTYSITQNKNNADNNANQILFCTYYPHYY